MGRTRRNRPNVPGVETSTHGIYTLPASWDRAVDRANREGVTISFVLNELLEGYVQGHVNVEDAPPSSGTAISRSFRCSDQTWRLIRTRAKYERRSINSVLTGIVHGYGAGRLNLPRVVKKF